MDGATLAVMADRIKEEVDIVEAASWFGYDYDAKGPFPCPLCHDVSRSRLVLKLYDEDARRGFKNRWYCFHCKIGGDVIDWVAARLDTRKGHAISTLADRLGFSGDPLSMLDWLRSELSAPRRRDLASESSQDDAARAVLSLTAEARRSGPIERLLIVDRLLGMARSRDLRLRERAIEVASGPIKILPTRCFDGHLLCHRDAREMRDAIVRRRVEPFFGYAVSRGWLTDEVESYTVGACDNPAHWMFGRVVFPIRDSSGRYIGFGGRVMIEGAGPKPNAKYLNSPDGPLFRKGRTLYGLDLAAGAMMRDRFGVLVEGYADVLACRNSGLDGVVATCGTSFTHAQAESFSLFADRAVILYDGDKAGQAAAARAARILSGVRVRPFVARCPAGLDPDDVARAHGPIALRRLVASALASRPDRRLDRAAESLRGS